jgi:hypothetical protein
MQNARSSKSCLDTTINNGDHIIISPLEHSSWAGYSCPGVKAIETLFQHLFFVADILHYVVSKRPDF